MKVIIHGAYFDDGKAAIQGINMEETEWCCNGLKNSDNHIQFNYERSYFESGSMVDIGCGGFGDFLTDTKPIDECPYCGASHVDLEIEKHGHKSINDASEAIRK